jgi:cytochrome c-type biogenesis protein CcmH/NrfG
MKRILAVLLFCLAAAGAAHAGTPAEDEALYRTAIDEGVALLRAGSRDGLQRSIARFKTALKIRPDSAEAFYWQALAYSDLENYPRAADSAKDATTYDDRFAAAWLLWGQTLVYQGDWTNALVKLQTAEQLAPDDPAVLYNLGRVFYHGLRDPDAALAKFRSAWTAGQALRRDNPEMIALTVKSRFYMGCCEYERGLRQENVLNFENAVNAFSDVINEQPYNLDARLRLALALRKVGRLGESLGILQGLMQALTQAGEGADRQMLAEIHLQLADIYMKEPQRKDISMVLAQLGEFVRLTGERTHPALEAAREYLALHNFDPAGAAGQP